MTPTPGHRTRRRSGFTLIEVLATMVLIGIALPVAHMAIQVALKAAENARHVTEATDLAQSKIGEMITLGEWMNVNSGDFGVEHANFRWVCQHTPRDYGTNEVTLTVFWLERGSERHITVTTLATDPLAAADAEATAETTTGTGTGTGQ